jgi:hypothetical protein
LSRHINPSKVEIVRQTDATPTVNYDIVSLAVSIETLKGVLIMKRIINGKVYNTETAEKVAFWDNDLFANDFGYMSEALYITRKGNYFIHGKGGATSKYAKHAHGGRIAGESIVVITEKDALEWCETREINTEIVSSRFEIEEA